MSDLLSEFKLVTNLLNEHQIDFAVCGGWAMAIHGFPRATIDIDLLIREDSLQKVKEILAPNDYVIEGKDLSFDAGLIEIRRVSKIDKDTKRLYTVDLLLVTAGLESVWSNREYFEWEEGRISCVDIKGLITMKEISGRDQDVVDIKTLRGASL